MKLSGILQGSLLAAVLLFTAVSARAADYADEQDTVNRARITLGHLRTDKEFGNAAELLRTARGVLVFPQIVKAAFFFGGEGGNGVLMARAGGGWSNPAFYTIGSGSFGLQAGVEVSEMVMIIRSEKALRAVMQDRFKVGADAGLTVVTLGSNVGAGTTAAVGADIVVWASSSGAYAGISVNGSLIEPRPSYNQAYYGRPVTPADIVLRRDVRNPAAAPLVRTLGGA